MKTELLDKIRSRRARIGVIGLGYVGLPLVLRFGEEGFSVIGFDVDLEKIRMLNRGESYIHHISGDRVAPLVQQNRLEATADFGRLNEPDCIIICVPTPLTPKKEPDLQYIERSAESVCRTLRPGQLVSLESTSYPGTTDELLLDRFKSTGLTAGTDYFLVYSPEREDPGNQRFSTRTIPKVIGGTTSDCLEVGTALYGAVIERVVPMSSTRSAELVKLLENIYRSVNIAMVNELKILSDRMGIDIYEVIEAAATKPFGFTPFYPGPGLGGHCIPIDPFYLSWKAQEYDFPARFIQLAGEINTAIPHYVVEKLAGSLNEHSLAVKGSRILILGVAYKRDVGDTRESPAFVIMEDLRRRGARLSYSDPYVPRLLPTREHDFSELSSVPLTPEVLRSHDAVLIVTDHGGVDYEAVVDHAPIVVDTRNATRNVTRGRERIVRA